MAATTAAGGRGEQHRQLQTGESPPAQGGPSARGNPVAPPRRGLVRSHSTSLVSVVISEPRPLAGLEKMEGAALRRRAASGRRARKALPICRWTRSRRTQWRPTSATGGPPPCSGVDYRIADCHGRAMGVLIHGMYPRLLRRGRNNVRRPCTNISQPAPSAVEGRVIEDAVVPALARPAEPSCVDARPDVSRHTRSCLVPLAAAPVACRQGHAQGHRRLRPSGFGMSVPARLEVAMR
jgi:hypothetical protein